jgi:mono/diheme cytochrome c family protein
MPAWKGLLSDAQIGELVGTVKQFSPRFAGESSAPVKATPAAPTGPDSIARGRSAYDAFGCAACHGDGGSPPAVGAAPLKDVWGHAVAATDLTEPWSFRGGATAADVYMRLKTGIDGSPMPSFADGSNDRDLWDLANYVVSLGRKPAWQMTAAELSTLYASHEARAGANPVARGKYLVDTLACAHCHSPIDAEGRILPGMRLAGGLRMRLVVWGEVVSANLTSDNETGVGRYSDDDLRRAFTRGVKRDDSRMLPFPMAWPAYAHLTLADQNAIIAYLRTVPPVKNRIPPPSPPGLVAYLLSKFQMLLRGQDLPIVLFGGNAGAAGNTVTR